MRNQTVSTKLATDGQKDDLLATAIQAVSKMFRSMTFEEAEALQSNKSVLNNAINKALEPFIRTKSVQYWFDQWTYFYTEVFGLECDYSSLRVPASRDGFGWLVVADERISTQQAYKKMDERFDACKDTDQSLNKAIKHDDRGQTNGTYAVWFRDTVEADEIHKNKSVKDITAAGIERCTARERFLLELFYEWKNPGKHLDIANWTSCGGSRSADGRVPDCSWSPANRKFFVCSGYFIDSHFDNLGCREVIS